MLRIKVSKNNSCSGCRLCEVACSLAHFGEIDRHKSAIRVLKRDLLDSSNRPAVCLQCNNRKCLGGGENIIELEEMGKFQWPASRAENCPHRVLFTNQGYTYHCDLCNGDPMCLKVCTTGTLSLGGVKAGED